MPARKQSAAPAPKAAKVRGGKAPVVRTSKPTAAAPAPTAPVIAGAVGASAWTLRNLTPTEEPDVFLNADGVRVDKAGVAVAYKQAQYRDTARLEKALGRKISTPAELLCATALDDTLPLHVRMDAAKAAAPYFDRKQPISVENKELPTTPFSPEQLRNLKDKDLDRLANLLAELGLDQTAAPAAPSAKRRGAPLQADE